MWRRGGLWCWALLWAVLLPTRALAFDGVADARPYESSRFHLFGPDLVLSLNGELELEVHDLAGSGGPGHDSTSDHRTIGTRSTTAEIDALWLALGLRISTEIETFTVLELTPRQAAVGAAWARYAGAAPGWLAHQVEAGYQPPFVGADRRTERYPLIGTIYWREAELHATYVATANVGAAASVTAGISAAVMRPLVFAGVHDGHAQQGTINVLGYGRARSFSGNRSVWGAKLTGDLHGAFAEIFGFAGALAAAAGTDELRNNFSGFGDLPGYNAEDPIQQDTSFHWAGARLGYRGHGLRLWVEGIASRESLIRRRGGYAQASYELSLWDSSNVFHTWEPVVRYEIYRIPGSTIVRSAGRALRSPAPSEAVTWDFRVLTLALSTRVHRDIVRLRAEYSLIEEANGVPDLNIADSSLRNNELIVQLEITF